MTGTEEDKMIDKCSCKLSLDDESILKFPLSVLISAKKGDRKLTIVSQQRTMKIIHSAIPALNDRSSPMFVMPLPAH